MTQAALKLQKEHLIKDKKKQAAVKKNRRQIKDRQAGAEVQKPVVGAAKAKVLKTRRAAVTYHPVESKKLHGRQLPAFLYQLF